MQKKILLEKNIIPSQQNFAELHEDLKTSLKVEGDDYGFADSVALTAFELLENAIKHGSNDSDTGGIPIKVFTDMNITTVEVRNKISADQESKLDRLDAIIQKIRGYQNPVEIYRETLRQLRSARISPPPFGIVRLAYEALADIDFYMTDGDEVCVSAQLSRDRHRGGVRSITTGAIK